jgi:hypothetical protein
MHEYRVAECWSDDKQFLLRCKLGRVHIARALNGMPPTGAALDGDQPHLGFGILQCQITGALYRVIFESINVTQPTSGPARAPASAGT